MFDEQAVIDWISQMIAGEPHDVTSRYPSFSDQYGRTFSFYANDGGPAKVRITAEIKQAQIGYLWIYGEVFLHLPNNDSHTTNTCHVTFDLSDPSPAMREAWSARILELLRTYGPDRDSWPRLSWERART